MTTSQVEGKPVNDNGDDIELKQLEVEEPKRITLKTRKGYDLVSQSSINEKSTNFKTKIKTYCECKVVHQILLNLAVIYCVIGVTYLLAQNNHSNTSSVTTVPTTTIPTTTETTLEPTSMPSRVDSDVGSNESTSVSTQDPSEYTTPTPTNRPTLQPTIDHSVYSNYIGDFKISAQNSRHGNWLLCDGSFLDSNNEDYATFLR